MEGLRGDLCVDVSSMLVGNGGFERGFVLVGEGAL